MYRSANWPGVCRLKNLAFLLLLFMLFQEASGQNDDTRIIDGLIAYYPFIEGSGSLVEDLSSVDSTLNLTISGDNVTWLTGRNGVSIEANSIISSIAPASKLFREIVNNGAFSIEIWCKISDLTQSGPARLISYSGGPSVRNVTLGQDSLSIAIRIRTTTTTNNGIPQQVSGPVITNDEAHYVVTYSEEGDERLYMNGSEVMLEPLPGNLSNWNNSYPLIIGNELTGDRPWLGEVYLVAIYNRELSQNEIIQNFSAGSVVETGNREPEAPTLVSPGNGTILNSSSPPVILKWGVPKDGDNDPLHFRIEIAQDTSFNSASIIESRTDVAGFAPTPPVSPGQDTASYSLPSVLTDGKYWWRVSAWDSLVYGTPSLPNYFIVDRTPPAGTLARSPSVSLTEDFEVNWSRGTDSGSGLSGLFDVMVQVNGGPWMVWQSSFPDTFSIYNGQQGQTYGFEAAAHDSAGNIELFSQVPETITLVDTVTNDVTAPGPPLSLTASGSNPSPWQNTPSFQISWESPADRSGINRALYKLGSPPTANFDTTASAAGESPLSFVARQEDGQNFYLWFQDGQDNVDYRNNSSVLLRYDGTVPEISELAFQNPDFDPHWFNQNKTSLVTINVKYNENHLQLINLESQELNSSIVLENVPSGENISFNLGLNINNKPDGLFELEVSLIDSAGNNRQASIDLGLDTSPPTGTQTSSPDTSTSETFTVTWTGTGTDNDGSGLSGVYDVRYQVDNEPWQSLQRIFQGTSITFQGEHGRTYGFEVVAHDNVGNVESFSDTAETVTVVDTGFVDSEPPIISHQPPVSVDEGQDVIIQANIQDNFKIAQAVLFYRQSGKDIFQPMQMSSDGGSTYSITISAADISIYGINYYIMAWDGFHFSYFPASNWDTLPLNLSVRITGTNNQGLLKETAQPGGAESTFYRMISVPLNLDDKNALSVFGDDLGQYDSSVWRLFQYNSGTDSYSEYPNIDLFSPGMAGWLIVRDSDKRIDSGVGTSVAANRPFEITLNQGWNDFGLPFTFPVDWADIQTISTVSDVAMGPYTYQGQWLLPGQVTTLLPWEGYSVFSQTSGAVLTIPPKQSDGTPSVQKTFVKFADTEWFIGVEAVCETTVDGSNYLGVASNAAETWDRLDYLEPPYIADFVSVRFPHNDWQGFHGNFTTDFRPPFSEGQVWHFVVKTNVENNPVKLRFDYLESLPANFQVSLLDNTTFQKINIQQIFEYEFVPEQTSLEREFDLIIGTNDYVANSGELTELAPESFFLSQNFPNPFNAGTSLFYQIKEQSDVRIKVLNILGQEVRELLSENQIPGTYRVNWDGTADNGHEMGSGIYMIQFEAGKFQQIRKVVLIR